MGLKEKPYIMLEHLNNLKKICDKYDMKPIIWDDMFFSNYSKLEKMMIILKYLMELVLCIGIIIILINSINMTE